jgi:hypothetical protein
MGGGRRGVTTVLIVLSKIQHQQDLRAVEKQNKGT